ncbi:MAG: ArsR family transcriptional regulator, partial [Microbacteriaceae bacterium]|nr:ArsR family transcriptional regulator [Microbacteriaceae bacterium]
RSHCIILTDSFHSVKIEAMNTELMNQLEQRAAKHAALADPARLPIVDLLTLGEVPPGDLQSTLDMPSNLVAHHLKVLEGEGMVVRRRSEADRRRSYVHLLPDAFVGITPGAAGSAHRVVFVCTANSARSQLATALWEQASSIPAASAGTHPAERVEPGAIDAARRHDLVLQTTTPRLLDDVLTVDDLIITVCDNAHEELGGRGDLHWSVPDPVRVGTDAAFDAAFEDIAHRIDGLAPRLTNA